MRRSMTRTGLVRKKRQIRFAIRDWVNRLIDVPAFVIGNGTSIDRQPIADLQHFFTIGINRCFYTLDPTILFWQDISLWNSEYHKLHNTQAIKVSRDVSDPRKVYYNFHLKGGDYQFNPSVSHILYGRGSTGPLAVQLAVALGCRPIILLGMDCKRGPNGKSDFWGENKFWTPATIDNCMKGLLFVKEQCPVEVYNCSENTLWPQMTLNEVFEMIDVDRYQRDRQSYVTQLLNLTQ